MKKPKRIFVVGHMGAGKAFLDKQHLERDSLFEEAATLTIEPISVEEDVNKIIKFLLRK